jgi:hypothetical protein
MLYYQTIDSSTLELLKQLQGQPAFKNLRLVGGTSLALQIIVNYIYPWLFQPISSNDLVLASLEDIAAMKLSAITGRGTRKDFIDMFFLLKHFSLQQMLVFYQQKYSDGNEFLVLKSLVYFEDAEQDEFPVMLITHNWEAIKLEIKTVVNNFLQS